VPGCKAQAAVSDHMRSVAAADSQIDQARMPGRLARLAARSAHPECAGLEWILAVRQAERNINPGGRSRQIA
jgi:hypothetical protein